jgi:hypothetical protein
MKILLKIILVISAFKAVIVLLLLIGAIIAWINGAPNILLPGLVLVISMRLIVILLLVVEIFLVTIVAFIWRYISKMRLQ